MVKGRGGRVAVLNSKDGTGFAGLKHCDWRATVVYASLASVEYRKAPLLAARPRVGGLRHRCWVVHNLAKPVPAKLLS